MKLSFVDILRYSPYDHKYDLRSSGCDEAFFIKHFRVKTDIFKEEYNEFDKALTRNSTDHKPYILLSGYSGCGKTTLLHYLAQELHSASGHVFSIINLVKEVNTVIEGLEQLRSTLEEEVYQIFKSSIRTIELIHANYENIKNYRENEDLNYSNLKKDLVKIISENKNAKDEDDYSDFRSTIREFAGKIKVRELLIYYILDQVINFDIYLRQKYPGKNIEIEASESLVICFDNMDELSLNSLTVDFWESLQAALNTIDNICAKAHLFMRGSSDRFLTIILTLRESNIALYNSQWADRYGHHFLTRRIILDGDVSEILEKRAKYIRENNSIFESDTSSYLREIINIFDIDKDWVRSQVLPLFNFDYRKYFEFMPSLLKRDSSVKGRINYSLSLEQYLSLYNTNKTIARGVMYSYLIEFAFITYFNRFVSKPEEGCNKYRMLLTIMFNLAYPHGLPENTKERNRKRPKYITIKDVFDHASIFTEEELLKMIIEFFPIDSSSFAQWIMIYSSNLFKLQRRKFKYTDLKLKKPQNLSKEESEYVSLIEHSRIYFNASAFAYLRFIVTHYEYYLYLIRREHPKLRIAPLALLTNVLFDKQSLNNQLTIAPCYEFEYCINAVFDFVSRKKENIERFYEEFFLGDYPNESEFSNSHFSFGENSGKKSFYITKLLFTHINYLDNFRYVAWYNNEFNTQLDYRRVSIVENSGKIQEIPLKTKDQIQDYLINIIEKYLNLCKSIKFADKRNEIIIESMEKNITSIRKIKSSLGNFMFSIDNTTDVTQKWIWIRSDQIKY